MCFSVYSKLTSCAACADPFCETCTGSATICETCDAQHFLYQGRCFSKCPTGTWVGGGGNQNDCNPCTETSCLECPNDQCNQCGFGASLFFSSCVQTCPDGFFTSGNDTCLVCSGGCLACTSVNDCIQCQNPLLLTPDQKCVSTCPAGTFRADVAGVQQCITDPTSRSQFFTKTVIGGGVAGVVVLSVLVALLVRWLVNRRFNSVEVELRQELLSTQEQISALRNVWAISPGELEMIRSLNRGRFGKTITLMPSPDMHPGRLEEAIWGDVPVVVRTLSPLSGSRLEELTPELGTLTNLRHPNLVIFFGAGLDNNNALFLVTELMRRASLEHLLANSPSISMSRKLAFMIDTCRGMAYLHSLSRQHLLLTSRSVLVGEDFRAKVF